MRSAYGLALGGATAILLPGCSGAPPGGDSANFKGSKALRPPPMGRWIDCHAHLQPLFPASGLGLASDWAGAEHAALSAMDAAGISRTVLMPPPMLPFQDGMYDAKELSAVCARHQGRFQFMAGGGSLNPMIHQAWLSGSLDTTAEQRFRKTAEDILAAGACGFGEMAAEHFSFSASHPYESVPPDHPLFLLLADIAAERGVPIDLHMEAVPSAKNLPGHLISPPNPRLLRSNIAAFENLLEHNRNARIIWSHAGWGHTGERTPALCENLLNKHPNLFMSFKTHRHSAPNTRALFRGEIRPEWLEMVRRFPRRFVIGSDQFYQTPLSTRTFPNSLIGALAVLRTLPLDLAKQVGRQNPALLFKILGAEPNQALSVRIR